MFYSQLVYLIGRNTAVLVHTSSECLILPQLLLNASFQEVVTGASHLLKSGKLCLLRLFLYEQRRSVINRNCWFCWGLFLDVKNAPSSSGWLSFQQPMQMHPNHQQRIQQGKQCRLSRSILLKSHIRIPPYTLCHSSQCCSGLCPDTG